MIVIIALSLMLGAADGPPPYSKALQCAGLSMAWSDLEADKGSAGARQARTDAEIWAFATMDAARRDGGLKPQQVEAAMVAATKAAQTRFEHGDEAAPRELLDCQAMISGPGRDTGRILDP